MAVNEVDSDRQSMIATRVFSVVSEWDDNGLGVVDPIPIRFEESRSLPATRRVAVPLPRQGRSRRARATALETATDVTRLAWPRDGAT